MEMKGDRLSGESKNLREAPLVSLVRRSSLSSYDFTFPDDITFHLIT